MNSAPFYDDVDNVCQAYRANLFSRCSLHREETCKVDMVAGKFLQVNK